MSEKHFISSEITKSSINAHALDSTRQQSHQLINLRGQKGVVNKDPVALVQDAQEEIAAMRAGDKSLESRKPRRSIGASKLGRKLAEAYLESGMQSGDLDKRSVQVVLENIRSSIDKKDSGREAEKKLSKVLDELRLESVHERFALLVSLKKAINSDGSEARLGGIIESSLERTYNKHGKRIRSGFNAIGSAREYKDLDKPSELTALYYELVVDATKLSMIYKAAIDRYGSDQFTKVMKYLISAAGKDMDSIAASSEPSLIRQTVASLRRLQVMRTIETACHSSVKKLVNAVKPDVGGVDIFVSVITLVEMNWPLPETIINEYKKFTLSSLQSIVWFHNELYGIIESVPVSAFKDERSREVLITAISEARCTATEDEELELSLDEETV